MAHYVTLFVFSQINFYLSPYGINIIVTGMLLSFSSLILNHTQGSLSLIPIALYIDSSSPLPFGTTLITLIGLHCVAILFRYQFRRESSGISLAVSLVANVVIHLIYTLFAITYLGTNSVSALHIGVNLVASGLAIAVLNTHYFKTLIEFLGIFGINIAQEQRQSR